MQSLSIFQRMDPRWVQIAILSSLTCYLARFDDFFSIYPAPIIYILSGCLIQSVFCLFYGTWVSLKSVVISCLSLGLLLKTNGIVTPIIASFIVVASKFWMRFDHKHVFNPSNFAIVVCLILFPDHFWLSPAQWGRDTILIFVMAVLGSMLLLRVRVFMMSLVFLAAYVGSYLLYGVYMGDPLAVNLLVVESGGIYLFAFFMLSDPKTSPDAKPSKIIYAVSIAVIAAAVELFAFWPTAVFHALCIVCLFVPLLNRIFEGEAFLWDNSSLNRKVRQV